MLPLDNPTTMAKIKESLFGGANASSVMADVDDSKAKQFSEAIIALKADMAKYGIDQVETTKSATDSNTAMQDRMAQIMERGFADMVKVMTDIATHTENTSVRVA